MAKEDQFAKEFNASSGANAGGKIRQSGAGSAFTSIVEEMPMAVVVLDCAGNFLYGNRAFGKLCGYPFNNLIGQHFTLLTCPIERECVLARFNSRIKNSDGNSTFAGVVIRQDCKSVPVTITLQPITWSGNRAYI